MQLLAKFRKILYMKFRATLNFRKFNMLGSWYCNTWFFMNKNDSNFLQEWLRVAFFKICKLYEVHWKRDYSAKYRSQYNPDQSTNNPTLKD